MFESLKENVVRRDLSTVVMILRILGALSIWATYSAFTHPPKSEFMMWWYPGFAVLSLTTAQGLAGQHVWGKWLGYFLGLFLLPNIPIGSLLGIALLLRVRRASNAGWFSPQGRDSMSNILS